MRFNSVTSDLEFIGCSIKKLNITNDMVSFNEEVQKAMDLDFSSPRIDDSGEAKYAELNLKVLVEFSSEDQSLGRIEIELEGAFMASKDVGREKFENLVAVNGGAALYSICRAKVEAITALTYSGGKVVLPFVNIVEYYKNRMKIS